MRRARPFHWSSNFRNALICQSAVYWNKRLFSLICLWRVFGLLMRMLQCWKRFLFLAAVCLGCIQLSQVFLSYCPGWICYKNSPKNQWSSSEGAFEILPKKEPGASGKHRESAKAKVEKEVFGRYRNNGVTLWEKNGSFGKPQESFSVSGSDVLVFLHIQKTGGTVFGKNMVKNLVDTSSGSSSCFCKTGAKRCKCLRPGSKSKEWLFSRFSTGWKCGLHADWTELTNCVDQVLDQKEGASEKRRYFYMTLLRNPYRRYLSEFLHVQRGATWRNSRHWCGGRFASTDEIRPCFHDDTWEGVTLDDFLSCPDNLATNRQTRMLAELELVGCYKKDVLFEEDKNSLMLLSAKENLQKMAFFGVVEEMEETQMLFEEVFPLRFAEKLNSSYEARGENYTLTPFQRSAILKRIDLDMQLYDFALDLFHKRVEAVKKREGVDRFQLRPLVSSENFGSPKYS